MRTTKSLTLFRCSRLLAVLVCFCALFSAAQTAPSGSPVILHGKTVITVHWGYANYTPEVRAAGMASRLEAISDNPGTSLQIVQEPFGTTIHIRCGDIIIASVFDGDAAAENTTKEILAARWANSFLTVLQADRIEFGWQRIGLRAVLALLIITVCISLFFLIRRYQGRLSAALDQRVKSKRPQFGRLVPRSFIHTLVMRVSTIVRLLLLVVAAAVAIQTLLGILPQTRPLAVGIYRGTERPLLSFLHSTWTNLPSILFIVALGIATRYVIKLVNYFFRKVAEGTINIQGFRPAWSNVTQRLVSFAIIVLAILVAYPYIPGSESPAFKGISIFLGVLVSLGSTGLVANIVTGLMLTYMDAFEVGHLVEIGNIHAYVKRTSLLTTQLITRKNELITVSNSFILSQYVKNYSVGSGRDDVLISASVGIGYESPWRQVEAILLEAASRTESVLKDPAPFTLIVSLDSYSPVYEVNAYLRPDVLFHIGVAELNRNVLDVFNEYGISIMTPSYFADPDKPKVVDSKNWYAPPADPNQTPAPQKRAYPPSLP